MAATIIKEESMEMTVKHIVRDHLKASKEFSKETKGDPAKARAFLIKAGILNKNGTKLAKRYR
jgi:hypothetical protein